MRKTIIKILVGVVILAVGVAAIFCGYGWFLAKQERVANGVAKPNFPYRDYNVEELNKMYPQYANENVATTQTPEKTYKKLKQAMMNKDIDTAISLFFSRNKDKYEKLFKEQKSDDLMNLANKLEDNIEKTKSCYETACTYIMKESGAEINFIKNTRGVWLIESL